VYKLAMIVLLNAKFTGLYIPHHLVSECQSQYVMQECQNVTNYVLEANTISKSRL